MANFLTNISHALQMRVMETQARRKVANMTMAEILAETRADIAKASPDQLAFGKMLVKKNYDPKNHVHYGRAPE